MEKIIKVCLLLMLFVTFGCSEDSLNEETEGSGDALRNSYSGDSDGGDSDGGETSGENPNNGNDDSDSSGQITAGEWNDLENWNYWTDLKNNQEFAYKLYHWNFYFSNRISVSVKDLNGMPAIDAVVALKTDDGTTIWSAKSDNKGNAELWINPFEKSTNSDLENYSLWVDGEKLSINLKDFNQV